MVIVRSSAYTHARRESVEEPGGAGGIQLRMFHHTNHGEIEEMYPCGTQITRYPFCLKFGPDIWTFYWPDGTLWPLGFAQDEARSLNTDSVYYCKFSQANHASHFSSFYARGIRSIHISKGRPDWRIAWHGGGQTLRGTKYSVHDNG